MAWRLAVGNLVQRLHDSLLATPAAGIGADHRRRENTTTNIAPAAASISITAAAASISITAAASATVDSFAASAILGSMAASATAASTSAAADKPLAAGSPYLPPRPDRMLFPGVAAHRFLFALKNKLDDCFAKLGGVPAGVTTQALAQILEPYVVVCMAAICSSFDAEERREQNMTKKKAIPRITDRMRVVSDVVRIVGATVAASTLIYFYCFPVEARVRVDNLIGALVNSVSYHALWGLKGETLKARYLRIQEERRKAVEAKEAAEAQRMKEHWMRMVQERQRDAVQRLVRIERMRHALGFPPTRRVRAGTGIIDYSNYKGCSTGVQEWLLLCRHQY